MRQSPQRRAISNGRDESGECRHAWQENCALDQACRGQVEQDAGPLRAQPCPRVQPLHQSEVLGLIGEIAVSESPLDFCGMVPPCVTELVWPEVGAGRDVELGGDVQDDARRHGYWISQEGAQESGCDDLQR